MTVEWASEPLDGSLARALRRDIRARRRDKGRGGHRFRFADLKELRAGLDDGAAVCAVLTHNEDPVFQHWAHHPTDGWLLIDWYERSTFAMKAAQEFVWPVREADSRPPGTYVLAGSKPTHPDQEVRFTMRVHCRSKNIAIAIAETFRSLGFVTQHEEVAGV
jgi:hypothetical protein